MQRRVLGGSAGHAVVKKPTNCSVVALASRRRGAQAVSVAKPAAAPTYNAQALATAASAVAGALLARAALLANAANLRDALSKLVASSPVVDPLEYFDQSTAVIAPRPKSSFAAAPAPSTAATAVSDPFAALPSNWLVVTSAAHWFEQHRLAAASGALLATVFVSDAAARAQGPLLERLRRTYGGESGAAVHFVFVHVGAGYVQRSAAASRSSAAAGLRGREALTDLGRVSHVAALHGLDVALGSFLPSGGLRAVPSLLLARPGVVPAGPAAAVGPRSSSWDEEGAGDHPAEACWAAASRSGELRQLVSDWAFINTAFARAAAASTASTTAPAGAVAAGQAAAGQAAAKRPSGAGRHGTCGVSTASDGANNVVPFNAPSMCVCLVPRFGKKA